MKFSSLVSEKFGLETYNGPTGKLVPILQNPSPDYFISYTFTAWSLAVACSMGFPVALHALQILSRKIPLFFPFIA